ncbi:MAG: hypothetical protein ACFCU8_02845 [Thermosynechococcaceae cyanobacterium]
MATSDSAVCGRYDLPTAIVHGTRNFAGFIESHTACDLTEIATSKAINGTHTFITDGIPAPISTISPTPSGLSTPNSTSLLKT